MFVRSKSVMFAVLCLAFAACQAPQAVQEERFFDIVPLEYADAGSMSHSLGNLFAGSTVRVQPDVRTNSVLLAGSSDEVERARAVVSQLDVEVITGDQAQVEVILLEHARAHDVLGPLLGLLEHGSSQIAVDERTNALLVRAESDSMAHIKDLVVHLDREQ